MMLGFGAAPPEEPAKKSAADVAEAERRERRLEAAFLAGEVPAVWYRQQKAALAADGEQPES